MASQFACLSGLGGHLAQPFVIVGGPRSGSTLLQSLLQAHPNILCMHELLKETAGKPAFCRQFFGLRRKLLELRDEDLVRFVQGVLLSKQPHYVKAIGFKSLYVHPHDVANRKIAWSALAAIPGLRVVLLNRDPVDSVLSFAVAREARNWVGRQILGKFELDPEYILRRLELDYELRCQARSFLSDLDIHEISYEELVAHPAAVLSQVFEWLGVPEAEVRSTLQKQVTRPWSEVIVNLADIYARLEETMWRKHG